MSLFSLLFITLLFSHHVSAQSIDMSYEVSTDYPFGRPNPNAPEEVKDFTPMIGTCECISVRRNANQEWDEPEDMIWTFKYIMNGWGVQDESLKENGIHSGSIRQYNADSAKWYVHYYTNIGAAPVLPAWEGNLTTKKDKIILYREQQAPNGMDGFFKITFYDFTDEGYKWLGEWVDPSEQVSFPTWKIECKRTD